MELYISNETNENDKNFVVNKMIQFNLEHFPDHLKGRYQEVNLFLKDTDGKIYGGLIGEVCWNWMEIQYLYVVEEQRSLGYGNQLLIEAERIAKEKHCAFIKLDTLSFQALDFYKKHDFHIFGTIPNAGSYSHYYLKKDL